ncbi:MAG TPA: alpha/beta hydrolase, partial [Thermoleophilia bacterium]|nr:alpha/beta hydrolase [Thermoleophilia bacterium]
MPLFTGSQATIHYEQAGGGPDVVWVSGGGGLASDWDTWQLPYFRRFFRNTTFDNRGVGTTACELPLPWMLEDFARDTAELIEAVCEPPVALVGLSFGAGIVQQVALDYPDLLACAIAMGTGARSVGWTWDYQMAEIGWRRAGHRFGTDRSSALMAVCHYAAMYYPARVLGDRELWPRLRDELLEYYETDTNEESLVAQWEPCVLFDQTDRLPDCRVPLHVIAFDQDVQAVPQDGEEVVALCPSAEFHLFEGMGHCSIHGHTHDVLNPFIRGLIERHLEAGPTRSRSGIR